MFSASPAELTRDVALELVSALAQRAALDRGIRILEVKGRGASHLGLRSETTPQDLDVLIEPAGFNQFIAAMRRRGWVPRRSLFHRQPDAPHAVTLIHRNWPVDVDVHRFFPGLLADPQRTFDLLWASRQQLPSAGTHVDVPGRVGSALVQMANQDRSMTVESRATSANLLDRLSAEELTDLARLSQQTGAILAHRRIARYRDAATTGFGAEDSWLLEAGSGRHGGEYAKLAFRESHGLMRIKVLWSFASSIGWRRLSTGLRRELTRNARAAR